MAEFDDPPGKILTFHSSQKVTRQAPILWKKEWGTKCRDFSKILTFKDIFGYLIFSLFVQEFFTPIPEHWTSKAHIEAYHTRGSAVGRLHWFSYKGCKIFYFYKILTFKVTFSRSKWEFDFQNISRKATKFVKGSIFPLFLRKSEV